MANKDSKPKTEKNYTGLVVTLTILINAVILIAFVAPKSDKFSHMDLTIFPLMNAVFNSFTFVFLLAAFYFVKQKNYRIHRNFIFAAFTTTTLFLISYLFYHMNAPSTSYGGEGPLKYVYYFVLITHIVLAIPTVLMALRTTIFGLTDQRPKHRKIARWTMPLWLYVSLSGVLVYLMISPYYQ